MERKKQRSCAHHETRSFLAIASRILDYFPGPILLCRDLLCQLLLLRRLERLHQRERSENLPRGESNRFSGHAYGGGRRYDQYPFRILYLDYGDRRPIKHRDHHHWQRHTELRVQHDWGIILLHSHDDHDGGRVYRFSTMTPRYGNSTSRISCMQNTYSSGAAIFATVQGTCTSSGCPNLRQDNLTFTNWSGHAFNGISYGIEAIGDMFGVIDHNTITGTGGYLMLMQQNNASYLGVGQYGDNSWANSENYGTANFLFLENNIFTESATMDNEGDAGGGVPARGGSRVVVRYNTFQP